MEANLQPYVEEQLGRPVRDVDCPGDRDLEDGAKINCQIVTLEGTAVEVTVTVSGSKGDVTYYPDLAK